MSDPLSSSPSLRARVRLCLLAGIPIVTASLAVAAPVQTLRIVSYNTQGDVSSPSPTGVLPYVETVLEGIGQQKYVGDGILQVPDIIALQETTSNTTTCAPIVSALNTYYGSTTYAYSTYQATQNGSATSGNGPNALIYNQTTLNLIASVGVGTPGGSSNGEYRQVVRYEFQPKVDAGTSTGIFYLYNCHAKSLSSGSTSTDQTYQQEEAQMIRNDELSLPATASVLYMGDWNTNASTDPSLVTITGSGQGQGIDALNPTNASEDWEENSTYKGLMTESDTDLRYRDDIQFMTSNVYNDTAGSLDYVANSAHAFGNNGTTAEGGSVAAAGNTALNDIVGNGPLTTTQVFAAENGNLGSDHLPVVADYTIATSVPEPTAALVLAAPAGLLVRRRR